MESAGIVSRGEVPENYATLRPLLYLEKLDWDSVLKLLIAESADSLLPILGQTAHIKRWLNVELPKTQDLRVDLLAEMTSGRLVHFEIQSRNWAKMPFRMLEYGVAVYRGQGQFPVQILIYAGNEPLRMPNALHAPCLEYRYEIVDLKTIDGTALLESDNISDNLMAILMCVEDKVAAIQRIVARIVRMDENKRLAALTRLLLTCRMRELTEQAKEEIQKMSFTFNIATDPIIGPPYRKGRDEGREEALRALLGKKFGPLPSWVDDRLKASSPRQIQSLVLKVLDCSSLDELFHRRSKKA